MKTLLLVGLVMFIGASCAHNSRQNSRLPAQVNDSPEQSADIACADKQDDAEYDTCYSDKLKEFEGNRNTSAEPNGNAKCSDARDESAFNECMRNQPGDQ